MQALITQQEWDEYRRLKAAQEQQINLAHEKVAHYLRSMAAAIQKRKLAHAEDVVLYLIREAECWEKGEV